MVRNQVSRTDRSPSQEIIEASAKLVTVVNFSIRAAAKAYNICHVTPKCFIDKKKGKTSMLLRGITLKVFTAEAGRGIDSLQQNVSESKHNQCTFHCSRLVCICRKLKIIILNFTERNLVTSIDAHFIL